MYIVHRFYLCIFLSLYLSLYLFIYLSIYPLMYLFIYIFLSIYISIIYPYFYLSMYKYCPKPLLCKAFFLSLAVLLLCLQFSCQICECVFVSAKMNLYPVLSLYDHNVGLLSFSSRIL